MKTSADILNDKQFILNFIRENDNPSIISQMKEMVEKLRSNKSDDDLVIPEWHKKLVRERVKNSKPENMISLEDLDKYITA